MCTRTGADWPWSKGSSVRCSSAGRPAMSRDKWMSAGRSMVTRPPAAGEGERVDIGGQQADSCFGRMRLRTCRWEPASDNSHLHWAFAPAHLRNYIRNRRSDYSQALSSAMKLGVRHALVACASSDQQSAAERCAASSERLKVGRRKGHRRLAQRVRALRPTFLLHTSRQQLTRIMSCFPGCDVSRTSCKPGAADARTDSRRVLRWSAPQANSGAAEAVAANEPPQPNASNLCGSRG